MGFSVKGEDEDFEYAGTPRGLFCQPRNLRQPALPADARRPAALQPRAARAARAASSMERAEHAGRSRLRSVPRAPPLLARVRRAADRAPGLGRVVGRPAPDVELFPVRFLAEFFANHGMLGFRDRPRWSTVAGGSARYVEALIAPFRERVRLSTPVRSITRARRSRRDRRRRPRDGAAASASTRSCSRPTPTRRSRCSATPPRASPSCSARSPTSATRRCCTPTAALLPRRRWPRAGVELPPAARAQAADHRHLLHEPPAAAARRRDFCVTLNRTEAIDPRAHHPHDRLRPPGLHARGRRRAGASTRRSAASATARTTAARTGAGAFTRTASQRTALPSQRMATPLRGRDGCEHASCLYEGSVRHRRHGTPQRRAPPPAVHGLPRPRRAARAASTRIALWSARRPALAVVSPRRLPRRPARPARAGGPRARRRAHRRDARRPDPAAHASALLRALLQPRELLLLLSTAPASSVRAVVAEVTNTPWGERHAYVVAGRAAPRPRHRRLMRRQLREGAARLAVHGHGPHLRLAADRRRASGSPCTSLTVAPTASTRLRRDARAAAPRAQRHELSRALARHPFLTMRILARI